VVALYPPPVAIAIGLLKRHPSEESIKTKSRMAGWSNGFLMQVLTAKGV